MKTFRETWENRLGSKQYPRAYQEMLENVAGNLGATLVSFTHDRKSFEAFMERNKCCVHIYVDVWAFKKNSLNGIHVRTATPECEIIHDPHFWGIKIEDLEGVIKPLLS